MSTIVKKCNNCNQQFNASLKEHKRGNAKFCSLSCSTTFRHKQKRILLENNCKCAVCNNSFYRPPSKLKISKSGYHFCSRKCKEQAQRVDGEFSIIEIQPDHYGKQNGASNYRRNALDHYGKKCNRCGYDSHEKLLQVHHKDRNRMNASIDNLEVLCVRCHLEDHLLMEDGPFTPKSS